MKGAGHHEEEDPILKEIGGSGYLLVRIIYYIYQSKKKIFNKPIFYE